jgi:hypothetical protein
VIQASTESVAATMSARKDVALHRMYWSFIRFADGELVYRNGNSEFTASRTAP